VESVQTKDGYIFDNEVYEDFDDLRRALFQIANLVSGRGGPDYWDELEGRLGSCWLDYFNYTFDRDVEPGQMEVSYYVWLEHGDKELRLTLKRLQPYL